MATDLACKWVQSTVAGFLEMSRSRYPEAAGHWLRALDVLDRSRPRDPRLAASQTNAGAGYILLHRMTEADAILNEAEQTWMQILDSIDSLDVPVVSISSSFHFRLASKNLQGFVQARRGRYARLCEASLAIARFNRLFTTANPLPSEAVEHRSTSLRTLLSDVLGPHSPEVRLLSSTAESPHNEADELLYGEKVGQFERRRQTMSDALSDECLNLETSVALTALLSPRIVTLGGDDRLNDLDHVCLDSATARR